MGGVSDGRPAALFSEMSELAAATPAFDPATARVLVVDDQEVNLALMRSMLGLLGIADVHVVQDGRDAVRRFVELSPDLVLLDVHMPGIDGYEILAAIRAEVPAGEFRPVLMLTAEVSNAAKVRAFETGASDFLYKPIDMVEAKHRILNLLESRWMHVTLQRHNAELQRRLDEHRLQERTALLHRHEKLVRIERALRDDALSMVYQPIMSLDEHAMKGYEALTRFSMMPLRPPNVWFQEADEVGLGVELELKAVVLATKALEHVPDDVFISVNTSPQTATSDGFADVLDPGPLNRLVIELTEHAVVDDYDALSEALSPLRARGMRLAVDDTGSGFSSLRHILTLRPDIIKLDLALTRHIHADPVRRALASALTSFAGEIDATLVAEGIESDDELQTLRRLGIGWGQGFFLGRPGPVVSS